MNPNRSKKRPVSENEPMSKTGQGYNDARGEVPDKKDIPRFNGQNVNNDPAHYHDKNQNGKE